MTFEIPTDIKAAIAHHAESDPENEVCGYWLPSPNRIIQVENSSLDPANTFRIDPDIHADTLESYPDAILYHTHVEDSVAAILSESDIVASKICNIPYLLYHTKFREWDYFDPQSLDSYPLQSNPHPIDSVEFYLGHRWQWERFDCFTLFRNFYRGVLGIELRDFSRKGEENSVLDKSWNQYEENFESQGFRVLASQTEILNPETAFKIRDYDVLLMTLVGNQIHHAAIMIDAKNSIAIQIMGEDRLSHKFRVTDSHLRRTKLIIRHQNFD